VPSPRSGEKKSSIKRNGGNQPNHMDSVESRDQQAEIDLPKYHAEQERGNHDRQKPNPRRPFFSEHIGTT
jgi:hypothetical protein